MSSLTIAVTHAIAFLTSPLVSKLPVTAIDKLHAALESQLTALYKPTWVSSDPSSGSAVRVLNLAPGRLPPSAIWRSGIASGVQWSDWIAALGGFEFDLFVDPGCVAIRIGAWAENFSGIHVIWQERPPTMFGKRKTLAQSIIDDEENAIFNMIDQEISAAPTWMSPILDKFPTVPPSLSSSSLSLSSMPSLILPSSISRPSSRSSAASTFSFSSSEGSDSYGSVSSLSTPSSCRSSLDLPPVSIASSRSSDSNGHMTRSRRSRARVPEVFIDASKKEVTNYDGGKTTVLTGGVMLGASKPAKPAASSTGNNNNNWRRPRW